MTYNKVYETLVATGLKRIESTSEAAYRDVWNERVVPLDSDPLAMAIAGGLIADRMAWVFVAGYQAACRHVFSSDDGPVSLAPPQPRQSSSVTNAN